MAFMEPRYCECDYVGVTSELVGGYVTYLPVEYYDESMGDIVEEGNGVLARLSAAGYLDCTDWTPYATMAEAREGIKETFDVDPDTGDELQRTAQRKGGVECAMLAKW